MQKALNQEFNQTALAAGITSNLAQTALHEQNSWKEKKLFLVNFFKNPLRNASVIPSSKFAGDAILHGLNWENINTIVELGPGSGTFTSEIIARCKPEAKLILIELEGSYVELLRNKFGNRTNVIHDGAHRMNSILEELNLPKADLIVSSLPFLKKEISREIFAGIKFQTRQGASFRFFTYMPAVMKWFYKGMPLRKVKFVLKNIPPMWIYGIN